VRTARTWTTISGVQVRGGRRNGGGPKGEMATAKAIKSTGRVMGSDTNSECSSAVAPPHLTKQPAASAHFCMGSGFSQHEGFFGHGSPLISVVNDALETPMAWMGATIKPSAINTPRSGRNNCQNEPSTMTRLNSRERVVGQITSPRGMIDWIGKLTRCRWVAIKPISVTPVMRIFSSAGVNCNGCGQFMRCEPS